MKGAARRKRNEGEGEKKEEGEEEERKHKDEDEQREHFNSAHSANVPKLDHAYSSTQRDKSAYCVNV